MKLDCTTMPHAENLVARRLKETENAFNATLNCARRDVGSLLTETTEALRRMDCGETDNLQRVLIAADTARASYEMLRGAHCRAIGTYREIIRNANSN